MKGSCIQALKVSAQSPGWQLLEEKQEAHTKPLCPMSHYLLLGAEAGHTVGSPGWIAHSWFPGPVLNSPARLQFPAGDLMDRTEFHDQQPACAPLQCSNTHGPPSPLHQHPLCWLKQHKSSRAAAPVQLHSSIQCSLSWELKDQCSDQVKHVSEFHSLSFASGMNKEKHSHYDHGITRCRQYLLTEKGCPFLLEIKKKLLMLQTANPHPLIMSARILIISH